MLRIDAGTVRVFDADPWSDAAQWHHKLAYVPGEVSLWPQLSGGKVIDLLGGLTRLVATGTWRRSRSIPLAGAAHTPRATGGRRL
jgi:ABC-type multidrug transport system ATPase subunit